MAQTILLIDHDSSHAGALKIYLARKHVEVVVAGTGDRARRLLGDPTMDIILANPYGLEKDFSADLLAFKTAHILPPLILFAPADMMDRAMEEFGTLAIDYLTTPLNSKALALALEYGRKSINTEKKLANYSQRLSDLHNAQILYHQLFNEVPCYITVQNRDLRLTDTNQLFKRDFGNTVGGYCYEIYKHRDSPCPECPVEKTFADGRTHGTEEVIKSRSGQHYNVITQTAPIKDEHGNITQVMEISTNITKIRHLQDHLSSLGLMLGSISHGIKGMLTALDGSIYQLETGLARNDHQRTVKGFGQIKKVSEGIKKMVLDILNYAKFRELQYEQVDVRKLAANAVATVRQLADDAGVDIETDVAESLGTVELDTNWMQTALVNFLENAVDACALDKKKIAHRITLAAWPRNDREFCLAIEDNGMGMVEDTRNSLFTLFFSSKGARGTGLGLFIANHVVEQHGGAIQVTSQPEQGTRFEICLPRTRTKQPRFNSLPRPYGTMTY
ncbi:MAG: ATP-binding protein [Desulfosudaceae bacterium]